jgi:hypothetical protein
MVIGTYDWEIVRDTKTLYPKFTGKTTVKFGILYVDQTAQFPDYLSGLYWASVEGELANSALHQAYEDLYYQLLG